EASRSRGRCGASRWRTACPRGCTSASSCPTARYGRAPTWTATTPPTQSSASRGVTAFCREGELQAGDLALRRRGFGEVDSPSGGNVMTRMLLAEDGTLAFGLDEELRLVPTDLGPMADSPWPCGGGNARGNTVYLGG